MTSFLPCFILHFLAPVPASEYSGHMGSASVDLTNGGEKMCGEEMPTTIKKNNVTMRMIQIKKSV